MKIAFITNSLDQVGGIERVICQLSNYFIEKLNYDIHIISVYSKKNIDFFLLNKNLKITNLGIEPLRENSPIKDRLKKIKEINKEIENICSIDKYDIIMTFQTTISSAIVNNKKKLKSKIIVTEHTSHNFYSNRRNLINIINFLKADRLVVLTEYDKKFYSKFIKSVEKIPNALPFNNEKYPNYGSKKILAVGRLEESKGFDNLIEAFKLIAHKYTEWHLHIIGEGSQLKVLKKKIKQYNLQKQIIIEPFTENIKEKYLEASIFALSSRFEGFGLVIIEAMECGLPIVSFDIESSKEILKENQDSLLARSFDVEDFANKLSLFMEDEDKRRAYGARAKVNVKKYDIDKIASDWDKLFKEINRGDI